MNKMYYKNSSQNDLIAILRKYLGLVLYIAVCLEMVFFPALDNFLGCLMVLIVWFVFRFFLKKWIIVEHPFAFLVLLTVFLARYIPLIATLVERKPITYGFQNAYNTFLLETVLFLVIAHAFYVSVKTKSRKWNFIQKTLYRYDFFNSNTTTLWVLGLVGVSVRLQQLYVSGNVEFGDVGNKFLAGLTYLQYAPILSLFPKLMVGIQPSKKRNTFVWIYLAVILILSLATNSRQALIYPLATYVLLFFLYLLKENLKIIRIISIKKTVVIGVLLAVILNLISDVSIAMLANRGIRKDIDRVALFESTFETLINEEKMEELRQESVEQKIIVDSYVNGWNETYIDNFMLNRFGNLRVSDQTIFHAEIIGLGNKKMMDIFWLKTLAFLPTPVLNFFGLNVNKSSVSYSAGDFLYFTSTKQDSALGGYRVTSLIGDGLATFGYLCFPIIWGLFFIVFRLLDCLALPSKNGMLYSTLGLISVFYFFGLFRNSVGVIGLVGFVVRGFWQLCFTYYVVTFFVHFVPFFSKRSRVK